MLGPRGIYPLVRPQRDNAAMAQALTAVFARPLPDAAELLRRAVVVSCALALILAGPTVPLSL